MNADGSDLHRVSADAAASEYDPQWSSDGETVIFRSYLRGSNATHVYQIRPDGTGLQSISPDTLSTQPTTETPAIAREFVEGVWQTYVTEGDNRRQIATDALLWFEEPQWSPDDRWIAFLTTGPPNESDVFILTADGTRMQQITIDGGSKSHLRWRP